MVPCTDRHGCHNQRTWRATDVALPTASHAAELRAGVSGLSAGGATSHCSWLHSHPPCSAWSVPLPLGRSSRSSQPPLAAPFGEQVVQEQRGPQRRRMEPETTRSSIAAITTVAPYSHLTEDGSHSSWSSGSTGCGGAVSAHP